MVDLIYDLETFPNCFIAIFLHCETGFMWKFEISGRYDDTAALIAFLNLCRATPGIRFVGFNNVGFDYPILHMIMTAQGDGIRASTIYNKAQSIISSQGSGFARRIAPWEVLIPQLDLFLIHHFDNKARSTGLKALQFNMRSESVEDLPFPVGIDLTSEQMYTLEDYCFHDITETLKFYWLSKPMIDFRAALTARYNRDFTNHNDTKIGKDYFIMELEKRAPGCCYDPGTREVRQTYRPFVRIADILFPYMGFSNPEFQRAHNWYQNLQVSENEKPSLDVQVAGLVFTFALGGIHASVHSRSLQSDSVYCILDLDVSGYYPAVAIQNNLYPQHLGEIFCEVYRQISTERRKFPKGTPENAMLKLANNGVFGDSGNPYSPFYDLQYLYAVTVNGQLLICMLVESILKIPGIEIIQVNTDGLTLRCNKSLLPAITQARATWEARTGMALEENFYSAMFIRDVNNYIAVGIDGKVKKRKGAYSWERGDNLSAGQLAWHQDQGGLVIQMAAEAAMREDADISQFIYGHRDIFDFMLRVKVPRASRLELADGTALPNICRYYVSTDGQPLFKIMPPAPGHSAGEFKRKNSIDDNFYYSVRQEIPPGTWDARIHTANKSRYDDKRMSIEAGWNVTIANRIKDARFANINYRYYIDQAAALLKGVGL